MCLRTKSRKVNRFESHSLSVVLPRKYVEKHVGKNVFQIMVYDRFLSPPRLSTDDSRARSCENRSSSLSLRGVIRTCSTNRSNPNDGTKDNAKNSLHLIECDFFQLWFDPGAAFCFSRFRLSLLLIECFVNKKYGRKPKSHCAIYYTAHGNSENLNRVLVARRAYKYPSSRSGRLHTKHIL